ncbi:hypothetical protein ALC57_02700, partial [Trachymyrmex cornetzi]
VLENWRPLALGDTVPKLFVALLVDRLTDWAVTHGKLCSVQKGFLRDEELLRGVVGRRIGHALSCEDIASFLSGSLDGKMRGGGETSLWSSARNAALRQSGRLSLRWRWAEATEEMELQCQSPRGAAIKIPPGARGQVVNRLRSAVVEHYSNRLLSKPDQSKVFEVSLQSRVSNHFIRGGSFTRFADWRFVHKARLDVLPLNGARRWGTNDKRCRQCGEASETLPHVPLRYPFRRNTAEAQRCPAPPLESHSPSRGSAG